MPALPRGEALGADRICKAGDSAYAEQLMSFVSQE